MTPTDRRGHMGFRNFQKKFIFRRLLEQYISCRGNPEGTFLNLTWIGPISAVGLTTTLI